MQTFLPFADFNKSLEYLDNARLNKQIIETYQMANGQWANHPAAKMWEPYRDTLITYGLVNCSVAINRGINVNSSQLDFFMKHQWTNLLQPWWLGDEHFHDSHIQNLEWKQHQKGQQPPYVWPIHRHEWRYVVGAIEITRRKKPELVPRKKYVDGKTTEGKPCVFLLQDFEHKPLLYKD